MKSTSALLLLAGFLFSNLSQASIDASRDCAGERARCKARAHNAMMICNGTNDGTDCAVEYRYDLLVCDKNYRRCGGQASPTDGLREQGSETVAVACKKPSSYCTNWRQCCSGWCQPLMGAFPRGFCY